MAASWYGGCGCEGGGGIPAADGEEEFEMRVMDVAEVGEGWDRACEGCGANCAGWEGLLEVGVGVGEGAGACEL